jgi:fatty-acyl-CoA synthase
MPLRRLLGKIGSQRLLQLAFRLNANSELIVYNDQRLSRGQVFANIRGLGAGLQSLGVSKGERVVTLLPACPESIYTMFLPQTIGSVNVPLHPLLGDRELKHILADSAARVVITMKRWYGQDYPTRLARLLPELPNLRHVIVIDLEEGDGKTFLPLRDVMATEQRLRTEHISGDELTLVTYTSGTTGLPKGVMHNPRRNFSLAVQAVNPRLDLRLMRCLLLPLPPYQFGGMLGTVAALLAGGKVVLMDRFDPGLMLHLIECEKVTQVVGSPTMYRLMLRSSGQEKRDLSSVQRLTFSTETCPPELVQALHERLGCHLENMYGTTESMMISWTGSEDTWERAATTVGKPVPGAQARIVDEQRRPLPTGEQGEIAVRTLQMMLGYYQAPELTAQVLDAEGWFYTGDVGFIGDDGYLRLVDRKSDMIIRGGQNIYPAEVENHLMSHTAIRRAAVFGIPHALTGESIWAYIERHPGAALTVTEVLNHCRGQIAPFKIPEEVRFIERLPVTPTGKIQKYQLRELALQELERGEPHPTADL